MRSYLSRICIAGVLVSGLLLVGCGDDDDPSSDGGGGNGGGTEQLDGIQEAIDAVEELTQRPTQIPITTPLEGTLPEGGGTAVWLQCSIPDCEILGPPLEAALNELGWEMETIDAGLTPEEVKNAWGLAVERNPDAVFATGFGSSIFADELAQLEERGTPVIDAFVAETSGNGLTSVIGGTATSNAIGVAFADWVLAEEGEEANVLLVHSSTFPTLLDVKAGFEERYGELCADCEVEVMDVPAESFGSDLPAEVVAKLRSNPDINYVVADEGNMLLGLPQAMETAGIDVGIIGQYPSETSVEYLADGSHVKAIVMPAMTDSMWNMADALARHLLDLPADENEGPGSLWILTPETAGEIEPPFHLIEGYEDEYRELWAPALGG